MQALSFDRVGRAPWIRKPLAVYDYPREDKCSLKYFSRANLEYSEKLGFPQRKVRFVWLVAWCKSDHLRKIGDGDFVRVNVGNGQQVWSIKSKVSQSNRLKVSFRSFYLLLKLKDKIAVTFEL